MKERQQSLLDADEFVLEQSSIVAENDLKVISQGKADTEYNTFFAEIEEKSAVKVQEKKLRAVCDPRGKTASEVSQIKYSNKRKFTKLYAVLSTEKLGLVSLETELVHFHPDVV